MILNKELQKLNSKTFILYSFGTLSGNRHARQPISSKVFLSSNMLKRANYKLNPLILPLYTILKRARAHARTVNCKAYANRLSGTSQNVLYINLSLIHI